MYIRIRPNQACDVNQNPTMRPMSTRRGHMMTVTANIGMLYSKAHLRWFTSRELLCCTAFQWCPK